MSMFHELMMRKKEGIMYATIKGTLTESPEGVFSGFSDSNYLELQQPFAPIGSWEVVICVTPTSYTLNHAKYFFGCYGIGNIVLGTTTGGKFKLFISTNNGSSYNIQLTTTENIVADTLYYVKVGFDGSKYYIEQSIDGKTYIGRSEQASSDSISSATVYIGKAYQDGYYWTNTVNLNQSYIKLNSTKYNLQAVVGYTVVGSPTITDGVVSGFSSSDYLQVAQNFPSASDINIVQEQVVFTTGTIGTQQMIMGGNNGAGTFGFELRTDGKIMFRVAYVDVNSATKYAEVQCNTILTANTQYKAIGNFDINNLSVKIELYNENNVLVDEKNATISSSVFSSLVNVGTFYIGRHWQRGVFTGSINLNNNNTYIKINNKLWFNGQEA